MPNNFGASIFDSAQVKAAPVNPTDVVRKVDIDSSLAFYATAAQVSSLQADMSIPPVEIMPQDNSLTITNPSENVFGVNINLVPSQSGLKVIAGSSGGFAVDFGYNPGQVPVASDVYSLLQEAHEPAIPDPAAITTTTTIDPSTQKVRVEVNLVPQGGLSSTSAGLEVNLNLVEAAVIAALPYASSSSAGLMTAAQVLELGALAAEGALSFGNTTSTNLTNSSGNITCNVIPGQGITIGYVTTTGNFITGLFNGENIWLGLNLGPTSWPGGWPNNVFWGIEVVSGTVTFSVFQDSAGVTTLASGSMSVALINAAGSPQLFILLDQSSNPVATVLVNTVTAFPVGTGQTINLQPQGVSVDPTVVALKSVTDNHETRLDILQAGASSDSYIINLLESEIATLGANILSSAQYADFACLSVLLEKWAFAHQFIPALRLESPNIGGLSGGHYPSPVMVMPRVIDASGLSGDIFTVNFQVLAVCKVKNIYPATASIGGSVVAGTSGRAVKNGTAYVINTSSLTASYETDMDSFRKSIEASLPGAPDAYGTGEMISYSATDTFLLTISDDGTGSPQNYYLNAAASNTESLGAPIILNYLLQGISVKAGATVTLTFTSSGQNISHSLIVPGVAPAPTSYPGYFMQVDAYQVANACSVGDEEDGGTVDGIAVPGAVIRKDLALIGPLAILSPSGSTNGYPGLNTSPEAPGWNGPDSLNPNGTDLTTGNGAGSTLNQPAIAFARDLVRLGLVDGGQSDDVVYDILVSGNDIWVAGAFDRWGNIPCAGLVRLDQYGKMAHDFNNARAGFIEPTRFLSLASDGNILAASLIPGCYQGQHSSAVHKVLRDGTEDSTFTCPAQLAVNDADHQNIIIGVQGLADGRVAVLCPETLVILDHLGNILSQTDTSTEMFLSILAVSGSPPELLLSSHAWASPGRAQQYNGLTNPKGLKLLSGGSSSFSLDGTWALPGASPAPPAIPPPGAGTGAQSTCGRAIAGPSNNFFIAGNALMRYNGVDTSWNCQILGNLLVWSENLTDAPWIQTGAAMAAATNAVVPAGVTGSAVGATLQNTTGVGTQAFISQAVPVATQVNCILAFYVKKTSAQSIPVVQLEFSANADGTGGTPITAYAWFDTNLGTFELQNVNGAGNPQITIVTAPTDATFWLVTFQLFNNSTNDAYLTATIFPAYSSVLGGTSTSVTGTIQIAAPSIEYDFWTQVYVPTGLTNSPPSTSTSNALRFQGLYKVEGPGSTNSGAADPNFNCDIGFNSDDGLTIPFCFDGYGNIYCGGPIISIRAIVGMTDSFFTVKPWMLYKLDQNGNFLQAFQLFDDAVTSCKIHPYGYLIVGGKFTKYGARTVGRIIIIDPVDGRMIDEVDIKNPIIQSSSTPDVVQYPGAMKKVWWDGATDPPGLEVWSVSQNKWVDAASGGYPQLPPVTVSDSPSVPSNLWVPMPSGSGDNVSSLTITLTEVIAGSTIWYTTDGTDPRLAAGSRTQYSTPFVISAPTIINAYATKAGYADSLVTTATYGEQLYAPTITPPTQNLVFPALVTIAGPGGSTLKYTTDGTDPATSGTASVYSAPFNIGTLGQVSSITVRAVAVEAGYFNSPEVQTQYGDNILPSLTITPAGGASVPVTVVFALPASFTGPYSVVYTSSTTGIAPNPITNPSATTTVPGPLTLNLTQGTSIQAYATAPGWTPNGSYVSASYGLVLATPTLTPAAGAPSLIIISSVAGSTINYTLTNNATGITGGVIQSASPAAVSLADLGATTITAYATMAGWANSATASLTAGPFYYSGLINVNFTPKQQKVGRGVIYSDPNWGDAWNAISLNLVPPVVLRENFYGAVGTPAAIGGAQGTLTVGIPGGDGAFSSLSFSLLPLNGDAAYKNVLNVSGAQHTGSNFNSIAYGLGVFIATTPTGQIWSSPDGINWAIAMEGLPLLTKVRFFANATSIPSGVAGAAPLVTPMFVVLGSNTSLVSFDGINFTQVQGHPNGVTLYDCDIGNITYATAGSVPTNGVWAVGSAGCILKCSLTWATPPVVSTWTRFTGFGTTPWAGDPPNANLKSIAVAQSTNGTLGYPNQINICGDAGVSGVFYNQISNFASQVNYSYFTTSPYYPGDFASTRFNGTNIVSVCHGLAGTCFTFLTSTSGSLSTFALGTPVAVPITVTDIADMTLFGAGQFVAVGGSTVIIGTVASSALTWADITPAGGGTFYAITIDVNGGLVATSSTGIWQNENAVPTSSNWTQLSSFTPTSLDQPNLLIGNFSDLPPGEYRLIVAAHGASSAYFSSVNFYADYEFQGGGITTSSASFDDTNWQNGRQFVSLSGLQTLLGEIGFGIAPTTTEVIYILKGVLWQEYASGSGPSPTSYSNSYVTWSGLSFIGGWPGAWPSKVYWQETANADIYFYSDLVGTAVGYAIGNQIGDPPNTATILAMDGVTVLGYFAYLGFAPGQPSSPYSSSYFILESGGAGVLGTTPLSVSYSATTSNPGIALGQEITGLAVLGGFTSVSPPPSGTTETRTATRYYLYATLTQGSGGYINFVQLSSKTAGSRLGTVQIFPESLTNLPFPKSPGGLDLVGLLPAASDAALGIGSAITYYYSITAMTYASYLAYLANPTGDPTPLTGTLYTGPFPIADNAEGVLVRAIGTLPGRGTSLVANAFFWGAYPNNAPQ